MDEDPEPGKLPAAAGEALERLLSRKDRISDLIAFLAALDPGTVPGGARLSGVLFAWSSGIAAWPARSPSQNPRGVGYPASPLRGGGTNRASGDAAERDGSSLLMNPVTRRHAPSKAADRVSRPHPSRVCLCPGWGQRLQRTGSSLTATERAMARAPSRAGAGSASARLRGGPGGRAGTVRSPFRRAHRSPELGVSLVQTCAG
jgi:hypothetical protein